MTLIAFLDLEVDPSTQKILDIGCITSNQNQFHKKSSRELEIFINDVAYVCGHNFIAHDFKYLQATLAKVSINQQQVIDTFTPPSEFVLYLTHKDVILDHFITQAKSIRHLLSGDVLYADMYGCKDSKDQYLIKFSKKFKQELLEKIKSGYKIKTAKINFIVLWSKEELQDEFRIILPELYLIH
ncbi:hypothetical protein QTA56_02780 [Acinetobacter sp. VNH17]|uniref:Uncharacterized protein n=1 Tax=Acinetobacter thutiue TaxID=2998078 RepID=A0ABT7WKF1_9GAMM|nr:hypothetical protein [Acinetobacter thutiue]MCY6411062.1 hypothetical protein [Acinetobacter thutiue]MDN0013164.1 hypothetical protein [Acinetobacter thutiue]